MSKHKNCYFVSQVLFQQVVDEIMSFVEYADMHLMYGPALGNATEAVRLYAQRFPDRKLPDRRIFEGVDRNLRETSNLIPKTGEVGRPRTARTLAVEENIWDLVSDDPINSVRNLAMSLHILNSLVHMIVLIRKRK